MKFYAIVGNPPYQETDKYGKRKDKASNLWTKFWIKSLELGDIVSLITPTSWLSPSADYGKSHRLWDEFEKYSTYANVTDVKKHFPNVGSTFGYVEVNKLGNDGLTFSNGEPTDLGFLPKSNIEEVTAQITIDENYNIGGRYVCDQSNRNGRRVAIPMTRAITEDSVQILDGSDVPINGSDDSALWYYVYAGDECDHIQARIIECKEVLNIHCRWSGFLNLKIVRSIAITTSKLDKTL